MVFALGIKDGAGQIIGFIICTENIKQAYRFSIVHHGLSMALPLVRYTCRLSTIRMIWETLRYPSTVGKALPPAEVLSIAVSPAARGKHAGQVMMEVALNEFSSRGIKRVKVAVAAANEGANGFYQHCGFRLATTRQHHNLPMNIYDIELAGAGMSANGALTSKTPSQTPKPEGFCRAIL
jgi:ribosomal protein S18 acetylase RimI-like enzyme